MIEQGGVWHTAGRWWFRKHNWAFYAAVAADSSRAPAAGPVSRPADSPADRILVHFDSHSDMHPAPVCAAPESLRAADRTVAARQAAAYAARLSVAGFILPALYYGRCREVWWVQPDISCFAGPEEDRSFDIVEKDGILAARTEVRGTPEREHAGIESLAVRAHEGRPVPRSADLAASWAALPDSWSPGPFTVRCMSLEQLAARVKNGDLAGRDVWADLDLDFFGTTAPLHGYGYLALPQSGSVALGSLGGTVPVFFLSPDRLRPEADRVAGLLDAMGPALVTVSESPEHADRLALPFLSARFTPGRSPGDPAPEEARVTCSYGGGSVELSPGRVGVVVAARDGTPEPRERAEPVAPARPGAAPDSVILRAAWTSPAPRALEASLFCNPDGLHDRLLARSPVGPGTTETSIRAEVPRDLPHGHGWDLEIRDASTGTLVYSAEFAIFEKGSIARALESVQAGSAITGEARPNRGARPAAVRSISAEVAEVRSLVADPLCPPSRVLSVVRRAHWSRAAVQQVLLAWPEASRWQSENLRRYRAAAGTLK